MRYELVPRVGEFVSIYNDIPNNAYVYSNELSSSQVALFKKEYDQFIRLNMSNKLNTANTRLGMFFNNYPNEEIYMVDLRSDYDEFSGYVNKLDENQCEIELKLDVKFTIRVTNPIEFLTRYNNYNVDSFIYSFKNDIEQCFDDKLNEYTLNGYGCITNGYQLNEIKNSLKYDLNSIHYPGLTFSIQTMTLRVNNFQTVSDFYNRDRKRRIELEDKIVDRLIDTVFAQYNRTETISDNQVKVLEAYFNNAIIESKDFKPNDFMNNFLTYQKTYSLSELIDNLDQANKRFIKTKALEDK